MDDIAKAGVATGVMAWPGYAILPLIINGAKVTMVEPQALPVPTLNASDTSAS
ncbi:hypothetical protein [Pantoea dispersa]|uniref:hypothetical protein n=1 Tax=Pantoea dispersa TaxID=59814 RepID=UPI001CA6BFCD|nr:hypothetical protein [Pantoea dispersa]QZY96920.1 hypothetical protein K7X52_16835 [Pantoea dispersa]